MLSKSNLRKHFRLLIESCATAAAQAAWALAATDFFKSKSGLWGAYRVLAGEPNCNCLKDLREIDWVYPEINGTALAYLRAPSPRTGHQPDASEVSKSELIGLLIPGLAFDQNGYRLGRGGGYFDRYLENYHGLRVGVCFEKQILTALPYEAHDQPMNLLLTEAGVKEVQPWTSY